MINYMKSAVSPIQCVLYTVLYRIHWERWRPVDSKNNRTDNTVYHINPLMTLKFSTCLTINYAIEVVMHLDGNYIIRYGNLDGNRPQRHQMLHYIALLCENDQRFEEKEVEEVSKKISLATSK